MSASIEPSWLCNVCAAVFSKPSFSEGPKTMNPATGVEDLRYAQALLLCPECLSPNIQRLAT